MSKPPKTLDGYRPTQPESGFFADYHNVRVGVAELRGIDGLKPSDPQRWKEMTSDQRIETLQEAENRLARVQGRPAEKVYGVPMAENEYGYYDPSDAGRGIYVNTNSRLFDDRAESLNTVVHEGRHAYQLHAVENPGFHPQLDPGDYDFKDTKLHAAENPGLRPKPAGLAAHEDVRGWTVNNSDYKTIARDGEVAYATQPVEHDAGAFGFAVTRGLYPNYQPSPDRIDQYNAVNARHKYGRLKNGAESQRVRPLDPVHFQQQQQQPREMAKSTVPDPQTSQSRLSERSTKSHDLARAFGKPEGCKTTKTPQIAESAPKAEPQQAGLRLR